MTVEHSNTENTTALRIYYCGREQCAPGHFWGPLSAPIICFTLFCMEKENSFIRRKSMSFLPAMLFNRTDADPLLSGRQKRSLEYAWVGFDGSCVEEVLSSTIFQSSPVFTTDSALCIQPMIRLNALFFAPENESTGTGICFSPATLLCDSSGHFRSK